VVFCSTGSFSFCSSPQLPLAAAGPAGAQFPNCIKIGRQPRAEPQPGRDISTGSCGSVSRHPYTWSTDGVVINLKIGDQEPSQFYIRGINYEPRRSEAALDCRLSMTFFTQTLLRPSSLCGVTTAAKTSERCVRWGELDPHLRRVEVGGGLRQRCASSP